MTAVDVASPTRRLDADAALPFRDVLFDEAAMLSVLDAVLPGRVESCRVVRSKYRIGESVRVTYELETDRGDRRVSIRCFAAGRSLPGSGGREADFELSHLNALGWVFPNDRRLWSLQLLWERADVRARVAGRDVERLDLASYAPEKAATISCHGVDGCTGFVKVRTGGTHRPIAARYAQLEPALRNLGVVAPALVRIDDELEMLLISAVAGRPLAVSDSLDDWARVGAAVAALHSVDPAAVPAVTGRFTRATPANLEAAAGLIGSARTDAADQVRDITARLLSSRPDIDVDVILHGDLHAKNVLVDNGVPAIIDLDQAALGPAAADLGSFAAAVLCDRGNPFDAESRIAALLDGYAQVRQPPGQRSIDWYTAAALIGERGLRAVNRVRRSTLSELPEILERATDLERRAR